MTAQGSGRTKGMHYREAWAFKGLTPELIADQLKTCPGPVYHIFSGSSELGDVKVDLFHPAADFKADARKLPFPERSVGTVLMDPPWAMPLGDRQLVVSEAGRILRKDGILLLYGPWWPTPLWAELDGAWVRVNGKHQLPFAPILLSRWRRTT